MKNSCLIVLSAVMMLSGTTLSAITPPANIPPTSLLEGNLRPLSVGVNMEDGKRKVITTTRNDEKTMGEAVAHIRSYFGYLSCDIVKWWTVFGTLGASGAEPADSLETGVLKMKWSAGTCVNIFHTDVTEPDDFAGRLSFKLVVEYADYQTAVQQESESRWSDLGVTVPISYELYGEKSWPFCNLVMYAGPAWSFIKGSTSYPGNPEDNVTFRQARSMGALGGVDVTFFNDRVAIGAYAQHFGDLAGGCCVRYHF